MGIDRSLLKSDDECSCFAKCSHLSMSEFEGMMNFWQAH